MVKLYLNRFEGFVESHHIGTSGSIRYAALVHTFVSTPDWSLLHLTIVTFIKTNFLDGLLFKQPKIVYA